MPIPQVTTDRIKEAPAVALRAVFAGIGQLLMAVDKIRAQMQEQATSAAPGQQRPSAAQPPRGQADGASNVTALRGRATTATKPGAGPGGAKAGAGTKQGAATKPTAGTKQGAATKRAAGPKSAARPKSAAAPKSAAGVRQGAETKPAAKTKPGASAAKSVAGTKPAADAKPAARTEPSVGAAKSAGAKPAAPAKPADASAPAREPAAAKPAPSAAAAPAAPIPGYDDLSVASLRARLRGLDAAGVQALLDYEKANARRDDVVTMFERRLSKIENGTS
jgi:hypothetical protein